MKLIIITCITVSFLSGASAMRVTKNNNHVYGKKWVLVGFKSTEASNESHLCYGVNNCAAFRMTIDLARDGLVRKCSGVNLHGFERTNSLNKVVIDLNRNTLTLHCGSGDPLVFDVDVSEENVLQVTRSGQREETYIFVRELEVY